MVNNGYGQSCHGTVKLTVCQKWLDFKINDFLHAGTNLGKLKVDLMIFLVGVVKNGHGLLVQETLKSAVS